MLQQQPLRVAILDLYNQTPNEGMRCLREFLREAVHSNPHVDIQVDEFDVRAKGQIPDLSYDMYISTGGPGSPFDGEQHDWEKSYFDWAHAIYEYNTSTGKYDKHVLFICHSFQLMCRCFDIAQVSKRQSTSFGITPIHMLDAGKEEPLFEGLSDPFYAADFRDWQVIQPNTAVIESMGGQLLSVEKERPHIPLERATTGIRLNAAMVGFQFHPEADVEGMLMHFRQEHRKQHVIEHHGEDKYWETIARMNHPDFLSRTHRTILPNFLSRAIESLRPEMVN